MAHRDRRRRRRNRGRFLFLYKFLSVLLIVAALITGCVVFFRVNHILVDGTSQYYTEEQNIEASGVQIGENLFQIDKLQVASRVVSALPYLDELTFRRQLPDTLVLTVTDCVPVAFVRAEDGEELWLIDAKCKLLQRGGAELAGNLAQVYGLTPLAPVAGSSMAVSEEQQFKLDGLKSLLTALYAEQMHGSVHSFIDLTLPSEIRFGYGDNLTVVTPLSADFNKYIFRLRQTLLDMDERGIARTGTLDLNYDNSAHLFPERILPDALGGLLP